MRILTIVPEYFDENCETNLFGDYEYDDLVRPDYCYLHGELQELCGYDIFNLVKAELEPNEIKDRWVSKEFKEGIYQCQFLEESCTLFRWKTVFDSMKGLCVLNYDTESYNYAKECYQKKECSI